MVNIDPPLGRVSLGDLCDAITQAATGPDGSGAVPLRFTIEDYAVVFSYQSDDQPQLYTRVFRFDPNTITQSLRSALNSSDEKDLQPMMREYLASAGIIWATPGSVPARSAIFGWIPDASGIERNKDLEKRKALYFKERTGVLFARATIEELDLIEKAVGALNTAPPQISVVTRIVEIDRADGGANPIPPDKQGPAGVAPSFGGAASSSAKQPAGVFPGAAPGQANPTSSPNAPGVLLGNIPAVTARPAAAPMLTGILNEGEFGVALRALEKRPGARVISAPSVVTLSGRQLKCPLYDGSSLDILPVALPDGTQIRISLQYSGPPQIQKVPGQQNPPSSNALVHVTIDTQAIVANAHTLVLSGEGRPPMNGSPASAVSNKQILIFITPTLIDAAGNRIRSE